MIARALAFGVAGWAVENLFSPPADGSVHYSPYVPRGVPFIPAYALGGVMLGALASGLRGLPVAQRAAAYAVATTGFELLACHVDRALGGRTWDYGGGTCVDAKHTAAWTLAALVTEKL